MIDTNTVGRSIAFLRKQKQMTQQGLAAAVNVSHQAVSKWENGVALPDMQTMLALSRLFGVSMEDLLTGVVLEAVETPVPEPEKPPIELKLEPNGLNMNIVTEADDAIARAMEQCEDEIPTEEPFAEAEPEGTVHVGMTIEEIVRMAPYVSSDALNAMLSSCEDLIIMSELVAIAPFAGKDTLARLVAGCEVMEWEALRRLAPFLGREALAQLVLANVETLDLEILRRLAPFLSRDSLAQILRNMPLDQDLTALKRLAAFLSKDALEAQLMRLIDQLTIDDLLSFAPFLSKDGLGNLVQQCGKPIDRQQMIRLAKFLPRDQMDKLVYRAMGMKPPKQSRSGDWDVTIDLKRAYHEIRDAVHSGVRETREAMKTVGLDLDGVMDGIGSTMKDVGGRINDAINSAWTAQTAEDTPAQSRAQRIRARIADKALAEGNWEWICNHVNDLSPEQLKQALMKCAAAGHEELIEENLDRVTLNSAEMCRLAQTVVNEDIWALLMPQMESEHRQRVMDYIGRVQPESLEQFASAELEMTLEKALQLLDADDDICEAMEALPTEERMELFKAALRRGYEPMDDLLARLDDGQMTQAFAAMAQVGNMDLISDIAQRVDEAELPAMALLLAENNRWDALDELLSGFADVDLTRVWPLAVAQGQWDVMDDIALHGDEATLTGMAIALADQGRYDALDSFIDELDSDALEALLDRAMAQSNWDMIDRISELLED